MMKEPTKKEYEELVIYTTLLVARVVTTSPVMNSLTAMIEAAAKVAGGSPDEGRLMVARVMVEAFKRNIMGLQKAAEDILKLNEPVTVSKDVEHKVDQEILEIINRLEDNERLN